MPTATLLTLLVFSTPYECIRHLDVKTTNKPAKATVTYLGMDQTIIELYGAHAVLTCRGNTYTAHVLEEKHDTESL